MKGRAMMRNGMRKRKVIGGLLSLSLLVGAALIASLAQAATSNGPYYAEPAWDQKLPAATRFVVLLDWNSQAVLDRETGLVWEKSPSTLLHSWVSAREQCLFRDTGNRRGWRLPSMPELASLVEPFVISGAPKLPSGHPFENIDNENVASSGYWSATTNANITGNAWYVAFHASSGIPSQTIKNGVLHAWCVRGGMNAEAY
jgi:Protein of unknown function (DUF1566)